MIKLLSKDLFYISNSGWEWKMLISKVIENYEEDKSLPTNKGFAEVSKIYGLWDHSKENGNLKELLTLLEIELAKTSNLSLKLKNYVSDCDKNFQIIDSINDEVIEESLSSREKSIKLVYVYFFKKSSLAKAITQNQFDTNEAKRILAKITRNLKIIKIANKQFLNKKSKLNEKMLKLIKELLVENWFINFTLNDLQLYWRRKKQSTLLFLCLRWVGDYKISLICHTRSWTRSIHQS